MIELEQVDRGVVLPVRAQAGARRNAVLGIRDGMLRVAVTAAPEKGKANQAIAKVISDALDVPKSVIELVAGATSPRKRFLIVGANRDVICQTLAQLISNS